MVACSVLGVACLLIVCRSIVITRNEKSWLDRLRDIL